MRTLPPVSGRTRLHLLVGALAALALTGLSCSAETPTSAEDPELDGAKETAEIPEALQNPQAPLLAAPLAFAEACAAGDRITVAAVGDVLLHGPLQDQAKTRDGQDGNEDYESLWSPVLPLLQKADLTYANFEGAADGSRAFTSYPQFNYNPQVIPALQKAGVDVVSTANNHALDAGGNGVRATRAAMARFNLPFTGTGEGGEVAAAEWHATTSARAASGATFKLAWLACSYASNSESGATNGIPDSKKQVLNCGRDKSFIVDTIGKLAKTHDAVIVTPHWGVEYEVTASRPQKDLAQTFVDAGAKIVFGNHPHVPQPYEKLTSRNDGHEAFVVYSIGNFVSNQVQGISSSTATWKTSVMYVGLTRQAGGKVTVNGARYVPLTMKRTSKRTLVPAESAAAGEQGSATVSFAERMYHAENRLAGDAPLVTARRLAEVGGKKVLESCP